MKILNMIAVGLLTLGAAAHADSTDPVKENQDVAKIKALLPAGLELAGAYELNYDSKKDAVTIDLRTGSDYLAAVAQSYIFADLNRDGKIDLAVAVEPAPTTTSDGPTFGKRSLMIFLADGTDKNGTDRLVLKTQGSAILNADDGGVFGDPFDGLSISKTRALVVSHFGGSADRWGLTESFYFLKNDFYKIGRTDLAYNDITLIGQTVDTDLMTGSQIVTIYPGQNKPEQTVHKKVAVQPLQPLSQTSAEADLDSQQD